MSWPVHPAAELFPMLDGDELRQLAEDIAEHGLREPVWLWRNPDDDTEYLLDGRNRVAACAESRTEVQTRWYEGDDPISFVVSLNIARRHLTNDQKKILALELIPLYEEQGRHAMAKGAADARRREAAERGAVEREQYESALIEVINDMDNQGVATSPHLDSESEPVAAHTPKSKSRDKAAAVSGTSGRGVGEAKRVRDKAPDLYEKVKNGDTTFARSDRIIRDRDAQQRRVEQAKREAEATGVQSTVDIRHGDFRDVLADLTDVDAIITDPPYPHEFIPLLGDLATWADKVLGPDGILAVLMGQSYLPEVYRLLDTGRPYRWTGCYLTTGAGYVSQARRVQCNWKPLIIYGGGPRFSDVVRTEATNADAKNNHKWGQDYSAFHTIAKQLTRRGETVVDPFMGSGTTLLAAHALGRNVVGCDVDVESVTRARERLT
jgi:16S rRNA G966 N2-methylase RsmD